MFRLLFTPPSVHPSVRVCVHVCVSALSSFLPAEYRAGLFTVFILYETVQEMCFFEASFL